MKSKLIGLGVAVVLMSLVNIFGPEEEVRQAAFLEDSDYIEHPMLQEGYVFVIEPCEPTPEPNEPSELEIHCSCGWQYKVMGYELCYTQSHILVIDANSYEESGNYEPPWQPTPEPNEPKCKHENINNSNQVCTVYHSDGTICWVCPDCGGYVNTTKEIKIWNFSPEPWQPTPEPNNPLDFIPTWPEYIELEKDLVIEAPKGFFVGESEYYREPDSISMCWSNKMEIPKGTKIYFKEEE